jgi:hypothetical protein
MTNHEVRMTIQARMKVRRAVPRSGILAVAAVLVLAAIVFTSCGPSPATRDELSRGGTESYEATYAVSVAESSQLAQELTTMLYSTVFMQQARGFLARGQMRGYLTQFILGPKRWSEVAMPSGVRATLKGTHLYLMRGDPNVRLVYAVRGRRLYRMPGEITRLLADLGMRYTVADVPSWTRVVSWGFLVRAMCDAKGLAPSRFPLDRQWEEQLDSVFAGQRALMPEFSLSGLATDRIPTGVDDPWVPAGCISRIRLTLRMEGRDKGVEVFTSSGGSLGDRLLPRAIRMDGIAEEGLAPLMHSSTGGRMKAEG